MGLSNAERQERWRTKRTKEIEKLRKELADARKEIEDLRTSQHQEKRWREPPLGRGALCPAEGKVDEDVRR